MKRYVDEAGSTQVRAIRGPLVVSAIARVEVVSAINRVAREQGNLAAGEVLLAAFTADWRSRPDEPGGLLRVRLGDEVLEQAAELTGRHLLRALDAIQLASALAARAASTDVDRFVTYDERLAHAAVTEGFDL